jgi:hypothetical protein
MASKLTMIMCAMAGCALWTLVNSVLWPLAKDALAAIRENYRYARRLRRPWK